MGGFNFGDFGGGDWGGGMGGNPGGGMGGDFGGGNWGGGNMGGQQPQMAAGVSTSVHTILMIRLLENEGFKNAFINRFSVLLSMNFSPERLLKRINDLQSQVESEMARDQQFWNYNASSMSNNLETIKNFAQTRQAKIRSEMESFFTLGSAVNMTLTAQGSGKILVDGLPLDQSTMQLTFYTGVPVTLTAKGETGVFTGWSDGVKDATRKVNPGEVTSLTAVFK